MRHGIRRRLTRSCNFHQARRHRLRQIGKVRSCRSLPFRLCLRSHCGVQLYSEWDPNRISQGACEGLRRGQGGWGGFGSHSLRLCGGGFEVTIEEVLDERRPHVGARRFHLRGGLRQGVEQRVGLQQKRPCKRVGQLAKLAAQAAAAAAAAAAADRVWSMWQQNGPGRRRCRARRVGTSRLATHGAGLGVHCCRSKVAGGRLAPIAPRPTSTSSTSGASGRASFYAPTPAGTGRSSAAVRQRARLPWRGFNSAAAAAAVARGRSRSRCRPARSPTRRRGG